MSFVKTFFTEGTRTTAIGLALAGLTTLGCASASWATPEASEVKEGSPEAHIALVSAIQGSGTRVAINHSRCAREGKPNGMYISSQRLLIVCQDNGKPGGPIANWTANDLDTLRHEAQHLIQDCTVGTNNDSHLGPVYRSPTALALSVLGPENVERIVSAYRENGAGDLVLLLEQEAFAVASMNVPAEQAQDIQSYCGA